MAYMVRYPKMDDCELFIDPYLAYDFAKRIGSKVELIKL
jgi:hypothetical protein